MIDSIREKIERLQYLTPTNPSLFSIEIVTDRYLGIFTRPGPWDRRSAESSLSSSMAMWRPPSWTWWPSQSTGEGGQLLLLSIGTKDLDTAITRQRRQCYAVILYFSLRYVLITYHGRYNHIYSRVNILLMIFTVWAFSFGMILPPLLEVWGTLGLDRATFSCTILK